MSKISEIIMISLFISFEIYITNQEEKTIAVWNVYYVYLSFIQSGGGDGGETEGKFFKECRAAKYGIQLSHILFFLSISLVILVYRSSF